METRCAKVTSSSLQGGVHSLFSQGAFETISWQLSIHISNHDAVPTLGSRQVCTPLRSPKAQWPRFISARSSRPSAPSCIIKTTWLRPRLEPSSISLAAGKSMSQRGGPSPSLMQMNLKIRQLTSGLFHQAMESNMFSVAVPWARGGPCIPNGFYCALLYPTKCSVINLTSSLEKKKSVITLCNGLQILHPFIFVPSVYEVNGSNNLLWPKAMES